jgi:hypothetical protein
LLIIIIASVFVIILQHLYSFLFCYNLSFCYIFGTSKILSLTWHYAFKNMHTHALIQAIQHCRNFWPQNPINRFLICKYKISYLLAVCHVRQFINQISFYDRFRTQFLSNVSYQPSYQEGSGLPESRVIINPLDAEYADIEDHFRVCWS